jgi:hypothetical protein
MDRNGITAVCKEEQLIVAHRELIELNINSRKS